MNDDEVRAMIRMITSGQTYAYEIGTDAEIFYSPDRVSFYRITSPADSIEITDDPRMAREIATALLTWANAKEEPS